MSRELGSLTRWAIPLTVGLCGIVACKNKGGSEPVADAAPPAPSAVVAPSAAPTGPASGTLPASTVLRTTDPNTLPLINFWNLGAWKKVENERKYRPDGSEFDYKANAFFERECPKLNDKALVEKDEFDRPRAEAAKRKARIECVALVDKKAGPQPKLVRLRVGLDGTQIQWSAGPPGGFYLYAKDKDTSTSSDLKRRVVELYQAGDSLDFCGGPNLVALNVPAHSPLHIWESGHAFSVTVNDVDAAKAFKARLASARALAAELTLSLDDYGPIGRTCRVGSPVSGYTNSEVRGYLARLVAVRILDSEAALTDWVPGDVADIPENAVHVQAQAQPKPRGQPTPRSGATATTQGGTDNPF